MNLTRATGAGALGAGAAIALAPETLGLSLVAGALVGAGVDYFFQGKEAQDQGGAAVLTDNLEWLAAIAIGLGAVYLFYHFKHHA
jgi:hypothetical protein